MSEQNWKQGQSDANKGLGPANHSNSDWKTRQDYNAGYNSNKK